MSATCIYDINTLNILVLRRQVHVYLYMYVYNVHVYHLLVYWWLFKGIPTFERRSFLWNQKYKKNRMANILHQLEK